MAQVEAVERYPERLEERDGTIAKGVRNAVEQVCRPHEVLLQPAIGGAVPGETDLRAQVVVAFPTALADVARDRRVDRYTLAVEGAALYSAAELVAEHERSAKRARRRSRPG